MWYELWDGETGNRVGTYPTKKTALHAVLEESRAYGRDSAALVSLGLLQRDVARQQARLIAEGTKLIDLALALEG